jgi:riboflavin kinase / FMN adenylyltransferase
VKIYRSLAELPPDLGPTVATIGNFDGVHRGHQWVIAEVIARAAALGATSLAITLDPHPARVLGKQANLALITPLEEKLSLLAATGIDAAFVLPFDLELSRLTAREFASTILRDALHVVEVHEGENFRFGHHAEAGIDGLEQLGRDLNFAVKTYAPRALRGDAVSSSRIRKLIATGEVHRARPLLGRPFTILSTPASGRGYGTKYTVPTINLADYAELLPATGVYITQITIGSGPDNETFEAVTNVGTRPTFGHVPGTPDFTVETHILNFHPIDLDGATPIRLAFLHRLRPEIKWPNPEALRTQIGLDVARAQRYFALCKATSGSNTRSGIQVTK